MLDQSVLDWMESLGESAEEVIGRLRAEAEVDLALQILMLEVTLSRKSNAPRWNA